MAFHSTLKALASAHQAGRSDAARAARRDLAQRSSDVIAAMDALERRIAHRSASPRTTPVPVQVRPHTQRVHA